MRSVVSRPCALVLPLSLFACLVATPAGWAVAPPPPLTEAQVRARDLDHRIIAEARKDSRILTNLTHLSDQIGPRMTGSASLYKANLWALEEMKRLGLDNVHLEAWAAPEGWERGPATARLLDPDNGRALSVASMAWHPGTNGKVQGEVVILKAQSMKELQAYRGKLKNAIVLSAPPTRVRPLDQIDRGGPLGRGVVPERGAARPNFADMRELRQARGDFLKKEGVAAILQDSGKPLGLLVTTGGWQGSQRPSTLNRVPTLFVAHNHYEMLYRLASRPAPTKTRMEIEVTNRFVPGPVKVFNTVGEIKGSEKPDEFVVIGAHLDSWDLGQGTTDNGTGTSVVLETARVLAKCGTQPRRTIRFVLFTGEEQGLHGSRNYVAQHKDEMAKTSICIVHDTGTGRVNGIGAGGQAAVQAIFERELSALLSLGAFDFRRRSLGGSDHASFPRGGVQGFMLNQEPAGYFLSHHTQADSLDRAIEADLIQGTQVMAVAAMRIANLDELLPRAPQRTGRGRFGGGTE
jgi:carboxypeptidase Q